MAVRSSPSLRQRALPEAALAAALAALLVALAPPVTAQVADPSVEVSLARSALDLAAANATTLDATVMNGNAQVGGDVVVSLQLPAGWTVVASPLQFPLAAGASQTVTLTVTAPDAGAGAAAGDVVLTATLTESAATARTATASAPLAVTRVDPLIPPPPPLPWYETTAGVAGIVLGLLALAGAVAGAVLQSRRRRRALAEAAAAAARAAYLDRETGVVVSLVDAPRPFGGRREVVFRVAVENASGRPRVGVVRLDLPEGWTGAPSIPRLPLSPGERVVLSVCVGAGPGVPPGGKATVHVVARPEEAQERDERVTLDVEAPLVRLTPEGPPHPAGQSLRATANQRVVRP